MPENPDIPLQSPKLLPRILAGFLVVTALVVGTGFYMAKRSGSAPRATGGVIPTPGGDTPIVAGARPAPGQVGGVPLFEGWPKDQPDLVFVVTGQTYGYLKPCGCSQFQLGGLERRANFMNQMREKGWRVVGLDLGDVMPTKEYKGLYEQTLKKYETSMKAMKEMGYAAVGIGQTDLESQLFQLLGRYTINNPGKPPIVLAGNLIGVQRDGMGVPVQKTPRAKHFDVQADRPMVENADVVADPKLSFGVAGVIAKSVREPLEKAVPEFGYEDTAATLNEALATMAKNPAKPELKVLLFQGSLDEAKEVAKDFPQWQLIACLSESPEPPMLPTLVNDKKTMIVQVGHKGRYVGVVGVFRTEKGFEMKYQLVPMGEEYNTPEKPEAEAVQKILPLLEKYAETVKKDNFLEQAKKMQHPVQVKFPQGNLAYVGSEVCAKCHAAEHKKWSESKHSHAYEALSKIAKRPMNRQYDPECIKCHVVGYEYETGFKNERETAHLMHNGCENCHGPGSAHSDKPKNADYIAAMFPWRLAPDDKLPPKEFMEKLAKMDPLERGKIEIPAKQQRLINAVEAMCRKCHDSENDPKFDFFLYFPQIHHSGLKAQGLPPGLK
jgi:2',3'-cyclic-nucleotide 2'-phosphodiesterase (5'-nucleotidase family)